MNRVVVYIDGFNLYHGLKARHGHRFLWLDLQAVALRLLRPEQALVAVKYFTAPVRDDPPALSRQNAYLGALQISDRLEVVLGRFQSKRLTCRVCGASWRTHEEKETDVSIAVAMVEDGVNDLFDIVILLSADSDLCPGVRALKRLRPQKRVVAVFPPGRHSDALRCTVDHSFTLGEAIIRQSLLPTNLTDAGGSTYRQPATWM